MRNSHRIAVLLSIVLAILAAPVQAAPVLVRLAVLAGSGTSGTTDGTGTAAQFALPADVALNGAGTSAVVIENGSGRLRRVDVATAAVTTAPSPAPGPEQCDQNQVIEPSGVTISANGNFALVANTSCNTIVRIDLTSGVYSTLAGNPNLVGGAQDGSAQAARFAQPADVTLSPNERFALVADELNATIRRINMQTGAVTTVAGTAGQRGTSDGDAATARFLGPQQVAISADGSFALVSDLDSVNGVSTLRRLDVATGQVTTLVGASDTDACASVAGGSGHGWFRGVALSPDSSYALLTDSTCNLLWQLDLTDGRLRVVAQDVLVGGITISNDGRFALLAGFNGHDLRRIDITVLSRSIFIPLAMRGE